MIQRLSAPVVRLPKPAQASIKLAWLLLLLAPLLGGCAPTFSDWTRVDDSSAPSGTLVASVTTTGSSDVQFIFSALPEGRERVLTSRQRGLLSDTGNLELEQGHGRLNVVQLPAGHYALQGWRLQLGRERSHQRWLKPAGLPPVEFTVVAGEVVYIGNLHVNVETGGIAETLTVLAPVKAASALLGSTPERDLSLLAEGYPEVSGAPLRPSVKAVPAWSLRVSRPPSR